MPSWTEPIPFEVIEPLVNAGEIATGWATRREYIPKRKVRINFLSATNNGSQPCLIHLGFTNYIKGTERIFKLNSEYQLSAEKAINWYGALEITCESIVGQFVHGIVLADEVIFQGTYQMLVD